MKQRMNENKNIKNKNSEEIKKRGWGKRRKIKVVLKIHTYNSLKLGIFVRNEK
jgi:hypothetical protein